MAHLTHGVATYTLGHVAQDPYKQALLPGFGCASPHVRLQGAAAKLPAAAKRTLTVEPAGKAGVEVSLALPVLVAGIDPRAEERLVGLRGAMVSGRYLREHEGLSEPRPSVDLGSGGGALWTRTYPAIGSIDTFLDEKADVTVRRLRLSGGARLARLLASTKRAYRGLVRAQAGPVLARVSVSPTSAWRETLSTFNSDYGDLAEAYWRIGPTTDQLHGRVVAPETVSNEPRVWYDASAEPAAFGISLAPPGSNDVWYRSIQAFGQSGAYLQTHGHTTSLVPFPRLVGTFNPGRLRGFSPLSRVPLQTFYPPLAAAGNQATKRLLGDTPLGPTTNLGGYLSQPPLLLTTLQDAIALDDGKSDRYKGVGAYAGASAKAPISTIQVRVHGVTGPNALSLARIKLVAEEIERRTGLTVNITAGSSPTQVPIELRAGKFGTPPLRLTQGWVKEDVDSAIIQALSSDDLILAIVVVAACCLFVGAATFAGVRQRRREMAILGTLGWRRPAIYGLVLGETLIVGLVGGVLACALAVLIVTIGSLSIPTLRLVLIVPVAVVVALVAGAVPAVAATRVAPLEVFRVRTAGRIALGRVRTPAALAFRNVLGTPVRSLIAVTTLAIGIGTLSAFIGIQLGFRGAVAGDLLGNVVTVMVSRVETISALLLVLLAVSTVADVLLTGLRERRRELGTLLACGWSQRDITRMMLREAAILSLAGSALGAAAGALSVGLLSASLSAAIETAAIAAAAGSVVTMLASAAPVLRAARSAPLVLLSATDE